MGVALHRDAISSSEHVRVRSALQLVVYPEVVALHVERAFLRYLVRLCARGPDHYVRRDVPTVRRVDAVLRDVASARACVHADVLLVEFALDLGYENVFFVRKNAVLVRY